MKDVCPHRPLQTILVAKHNDTTNNTANENKTEAVFLYATNIHLMPKGKPEFEFLTVNTLEKITRGEGESFKPLPTHIEAINRLAGSPNSLLFCPSFQKYKNRKKKGRPRKVTDETNTNDIDYITSQGGDTHTMLTTPTRDPAPRHFSPNPER